MAHLATSAPAFGASSTPPLAYSVPQAAALLGLGESKLWSLVRAGRIRVTKFDRRTVISRSELERLAAEGC